ncbi:MAG TPA: DUF6755 family protein [Chloroflexota bacterium]|nr:DUF6755 family protein [Chloroflexota bacterium]
MSEFDERRATFGSWVPDRAVDRPPPMGQMAILLAALLLGILSMGIQLWLLTVALELYLGGNGDRVWQLAIVSGLIFLGGLAMLRILRSRSTIRRTTTR